MRDYPEGIRSVILDSVYPPQAALYSESPLSANRVFQLLFEDCAADPYCSQTYPELQTILYQVIDELQANPAAVSLSRGTIVVDGDYFLGAVGGCFYRTDVIPWIPAMIFGARAGEFKPMAEAFEAMLDDEGLSSGMYYSLQCREELPFESYQEAETLASDLPREIREHYLYRPIFSLCESWQSGSADPIENEPVHSDIPTLVLAGTYDPITPPAWARLAAETLSNSLFYEFPGVAHGVMRSNDCALRIGLQFLDNPRAAQDTSCLSELSGPDFR